MSVKDRKGSDRLEGVVLPIVEKKSIPSIQTEYVPFSPGEKSQRKLRIPIAIL